MNLSLDRQSDLERRRAEIRNRWRISTDCGNPPDEARKTWDMVRLELKFFCPVSELHGAGASIAFHAREWIKNRNPFHIDAAVLLCEKAGIEPPPALAALIVDVARARISGNLRGGTAEKIKREAAKDYALNLMTNLCAAGLTIQQASVKAAAQLQNPAFYKQYDASSLDKFYTKRWRAIEAEKREYWNSTEEGAQQLTEWLRLIPTMPDAPPDLIGERR